MHDEDVIGAFDIVAVGTTVEFVLRTEEVNSLGGLGGAAHCIPRDLYQLEQTRY